MAGDISLYVSKVRDWDVSRSAAGTANMLFHIKNNTSGDIAVSDLSIRFWTSEPYDSNRYVYNFVNAYSTCYDSSSASVGIIPSNTWSGVTSGYKINGYEAVGGSVEAYYSNTISTTSTAIIPPSGFVGLANDLSSCLQLDFGIANSAAFRNADSWYSDQPPSAGNWDLAVNYALYSAGTLMCGTEPHYVNSRIDPVYVYTVSENSPSGTFSGVSLSTNSNTDTSKRSIFGFDFGAYNNRLILKATMFVKAKSESNKGSNIDIGVYNTSSGSTPTWSSTSAIGSAIDVSYSAKGSELQLPFYHTFDVTSYVQEQADAGLDGHIMMKYTNESDTIRSAEFDAPYVVVLVSSMLGNWHLIQTDSAVKDTLYMSLGTDSKILDIYANSLRTDMSIYTFGGSRGVINTNSNIMGDIYKAMMTDMVIGVNNSVHKISTNMYIRPFGDGIGLNTNQVIAAHKIGNIKIDSYIRDTVVKRLSTNQGILSSPVRILRTGQNVSGIVLSSMATDSMIVGPVSIIIPEKIRTDRSYGQRPLFARDIGWNFDEVADINSIKQSITSIIRTPKRTRLRDPKYGISLYDRIYTLTTPNALAEMLKTTISEIQSIDSRVSIISKESKIVYDMANRQIRLILRWTAYGSSVQTSTFIIDK